MDAKTLRVRVNAPPEGGKANAAVQGLLAKALRVPKTRVLIVVGESSRKKIIVLPLALEEVMTRLGSLRQHGLDDGADNNEDDDGH